MRAFNLVDKIPTGLDDKPTTSAIFINFAKSIWHHWSRLLVWRHIYKTCLKIYMHFRMFSIIFIQPMKISLIQVLASICSKCTTLFNRLARHEQNWFFLFCFFHFEHSNFWNISCLNLHFRCYYPPNKFSIPSIFWQTIFSLEWALTCIHKQNVWHASIPMGNSKVIVSHKTCFSFVVRHSS